MNKAIKDQVGDWFPILGPLLAGEDFAKVREQLKNLKKSFQAYYPTQGNTFKAFKMTQRKDLKIVIITDEPYCDGTASGLALARPQNCKVYPEIQLFSDKLEADYKMIVLDFDRSLEHWAKQGILLLNAALSVQRDKPGSHKDLWRPITLKLIEELSKKRNDLIFVLMTPTFEEFRQKIMGKSVVLTGFNPGEINTTLKLQGKSEINWMDLPEGGHGMWDRILREDIECPF